MRASFLLIAVAPLLPACAQQPAPPVVENPYPLYSTTTGWVAQRHHPIDAYAVLTGPESDFFTVRAEKVAYGALPLAGISSFTTYTYDAQNISTFGSFGYRYRWVVQDGISAPIAP